MQINIIFENEHVVAVSKPSGCLSVPSRMGDNDPRPCLGKFLEKFLKCRLWPIHRLDFEVSGLILFAKTAAAHRSANCWFEEHLVRKTYEALTLVPEQIPETNQPQTWESIIAKGKKRAFEAPHGKQATTIATTIGRQNLAGIDILVWHLSPLTGRSHQLRFELFKRKLPIIGDKLYGSETTYTENAIALKSISIDFSGCSDRSELKVPLRLTDHSMLEARN